jgi:hypothetical protein
MVDVQIGSGIRITSPLGRGRNKTKDDILVTFLIFDDPSKFLP